MAQLRGHFLGRGGAALVHESVRGDALLALRHRSFTLSHLIGSGIAFAALVVYMATADKPSVQVAAILACLVMPVLSALLLRLTGSLAGAHLTSALLFACLVGGVSALTGGVASFALPWLLAVPVEAAMSGSRRVVAASVVFCVAIAGGLLFCAQSGFLPPAGGPEPGTPLYLAVGIGGALVYIGMLAATIEYHYEKSEDIVTDREDKFRLLAENASDMITRHDPNGNVLFVSGASEKLTSAAPEQLSGGGLMDFVHQDDRHAYVTAFVKAADTGLPATAEFRLRSEPGLHGGDGAYRWAELHCRPIRSAAGGPCQLVAVTRDITTRKRQQQELLSARNAAEQASRAKTYFLANMSHELRTPLNSVIGFAEVLERELGADNDATAQQEYAELIRLSGEHLLGMVNDLLDLSRIEAGHLSLNPEEIDLNEIGRYCRQAMLASAEADDVIVETAFENDDLVIVADRRACTQIIFSLLSYAIKFSKAGGRIVIETKCGGEVATICIHDEGVGIAPEVIARLGQPFSQGDDAYSRNHEGVGLGLSIVQGLVRLQQGSVDIESTLNVGTSVRVMLPLAVDGSREVLGEPREATAV